jgi:hypothetical protein
MIRKKIVIAGLLLAYAIIVPVFAYVYFYRTETALAAGIELRTYDTPTMKLGFYSDAGCTQPITTIDYGNMTHPAQETIIWRMIFIRNEGSVWNDIYWNSTLASVNPQIEECWSGTYNLPPWNAFRWNGSRIDPGYVYWTFYGIKIPAYAAVGTFNWTLTVWGENYY